MTLQQDELLRRLASGEFGEWAGQGFVDGGITILRPGTWQWETITFVPGSAELMSSELSDPVDPGRLEFDPTFELGLPVDLGLENVVQPPAMPKVFASVIPAVQYSQDDLPRTVLGEVRMTHGVSNGVSGPLSPIRMGSQNVVDRDGNLWFPVVRMGGSGRMSTDRGGIGPR